MRILCNAMAILFSAHFVFGCGSSSNKNHDANREGSLAGQEYVKLDADELTLTDVAVSGTGSIVLKEALGEIGSGKNFKINFAMEDGGSLELISHSNNKLENGFGIIFTRLGGKLGLSLAANGKESESKVLEKLDASKAIEVSIDVHNNESPAHILIWGQSENHPTDDNALFNSDADAVAPGNGSGSFAGFRLKNASLSSLKVGESAFGH